MKVLISATLSLFTVNRKRYSKIGKLTLYCFIHYTKYRNWYAILSKLLRLYYQSIETNFGKTFGNNAAGQLPNSKSGSK